MKLLHYRADWRSIAFVLLAIACYAVQWLGVWRHPLLLIASMLLVFIGCIINHNHQHHPTFVHRTSNALFGMLITLAIGVPASVIVAMHNLNHHVHNNNERDHVRATIVDFRWRWLNPLLFPFVALSRFAKEKASVMRQWKISRPGLYQQLTAERVVLYPMLVVLLIFKPVPTLLYLAVPYLFGQWAILAINHLQHVGCETGSKYNHSRNFVGRWGNWWFFNNGFHTAHHLRPGLHWSKLPEYHARIEQHIQPQYNCRSLIWSGIQLYLLPGGARGRERLWKKEAGLPS